MAEEEDCLVPRNVLEGVARLDAKLQLLEIRLRELLHTSSTSSHSLAQLAPIDRASAFVTLSKTLNTLFCVYLRITGESPDDHPAKSEVERVGLYEDKVERAVDQSKTPSRPTVSINIPAANRFIEHSIPDLTDDQKRRVREVSQSKSKRLQSSHKRNASFEKSPKRKKKDEKSVGQAVEAFLAEAQMELLGKNDTNLYQEESQSDEESSE